jgi:hypothetical protein
MKKFLLFSFSVLLIFLFTGCAHYSDGTSVWAGGLWLVPSVTSFGAIAFFIAAYRSSKSGSWKNPQYSGGKNVEGGNVPIWEHGFFWFSVACAIATVAIIFMVISDK